MILQRRLILGAFYCLVAANALPAFRLAGDMMFGFTATALEFFAVLHFGLERGQQPAAALGIIANLGFLATLTAAWNGRGMLAKWSAVTAAVAAFGSVVFLATGSEHFVPYPGCVLWLATAVLLVLGTRSLGVTANAQQGAQRDTDKFGDAVPQRQAALHLAKECACVRERRQLRWTLISLLLIAGIPGGWLLKRYFETRHETRWVNEAQTAVEAYLRQPSDGTIPAECGSFQSLVGRGYHYPAWNINAPHLIASRDALFSKARVEVVIYVWVPPPAGRSQAQWTVEKIEWTRIEPRPPMYGGKLRVYVNGWGRVASKGNVDGEQAGEERSDNGLKMKLCRCPKGTFKMGDARVDVTLTRGCWMGKYEVTQKEYQSVMGKNPSRFKGDEAPVETVDWNEATEFCQKLTTLEKDAGRLPVGWEYRLPTEAQWEYACRAGTTTDYSFGDYAWYGGNSSGRAHPVGGKKPNAWGLHDMHGNVSEWCRDLYAAELPGGSDPEGKQGSFLVIRGGSWDFGAADGRSASALRGMSVPVGKFDLGFRVALVPSSQSISQ